MTRIRLTGYENADITTVGSLSGNLAELLFAMWQDDRALVALVTFDDDRYIQFLSRADGHVVGEVVSNLHLDSSSALAPWAQDKMRALGFVDPVPGCKPTWWFEATDTRTVAGLASMMDCAIFDVLEEKATNEAAVTTWKARHQPPRLSNTPTREE